MFIICLWRAKLTLFMNSLPSWKWKKKTTKWAPYITFESCPCLNITWIAFVSPALRFNGFMAFPRRNNICSVVVIYVVVCWFLLQHWLVWNAAFLGWQQKEIQPCPNHILPRREYFLAWQHAETRPCSRAGYQSLSNSRQWRGWDYTFSSNAKSEEKL